MTLSLLSVIITATLITTTFVYIDIYTNQQVYFLGYKCAGIMHSEPIPNLISVYLMQK